MCRARTPATRDRLGGTSHTQTPRTYDPILRVIRKNPKFKEQYCVGFDSSVVECLCAKQESRGSSPGSGLYFSVTQ